MFSAITSSLTSDAAAIASAGVPSGESSADTGGLDSSAFLSLHMRALGCDLDELLPAYDPVAQDSDHGPWVFVIPAQLRDHLASLSDTAVLELAHEWAGCEELQDDGVSPEEAAEILSGISGVARMASSSGKELLLWLSL
ncbi:hypothetical protein K3217_20855 [bacterium BD-1]|nr:hypothetical protein [Ottowia caeni]